ncbi:COX15/CtaA family protein [Tepidicella baoligensis]|uniref:COX15/CtaA family protein n=1 Tax=Tepidicella baoligensis TaxID=2707016 RepID=UPI0015DBB246|nr:COX15/CtaA family protein [Tepidicella baoligensis]
MDTQALYDLSPLLYLMALGVLVAAGPLYWVWLRGRRAPTATRLALLTGVTLFLTFDLVLFGAFTRLTDSGLGCPDWPGCYGKASPIGARAEIAAAQEAMPLGPVTFPKAWIEMIHRYLATGVGVLILVLAVFSWRERQRIQLSVFWPMVTLFWVCLQGAFGALTVTMKLFPAIVTLHLLGGMALLALLRLQAVRYRQAGLGFEAAASAYLPLRPATRRWLWAVFAVVWLQMALGGWVSTNYAVLACRDFPTCQGSWWPDMDFAAGFQLWRELGVQRSGESIPFPALTAIHYTHRLAAYGVLAMLAYLAWRFWRIEGRATHARWLLALGGWQLLTGLSNVVLEWPLLAAVAHTGGAAALVVVLTGWLTAAYPAADRQPAHQTVLREQSA